MESQKHTTNTNDHDLLIRIDERTMKIDTCLSNHLKHHWAITLALLATVLGLVAKILFL
ncbi:hypothetical protein LCGC14_0360010 [marine sediment metagenome]|uniref:Uncharacterized protein n=1 Tax=marine sediment metagenome TaxID=412755 RepID=A0A0F9TR76_9ZZZZ